MMSQWRRRLHFMFLNTSSRLTSWPVFDSRPRRRRISAALALCGWATAFRHVHGLQVVQVGEDPVHGPVQDVTLMKQTVQQDIGECQQRDYLVKYELFESILPLQGQHFTSFFMDWQSDNRNISNYLRWLKSTSVNSVKCCILPQ